MMELTGNREAEWQTILFPRERRARYQDRLVQLARLRAAFEREPLQDVPAALPAELPDEHRWVPTRAERLWMRDVTRYWLWMIHGLSRRRVALWEEAREHGEPVTLNPPTVSGKPVPRTIGRAPLRERAVGVSIQEVYEAIYLEPYSKAKARRASGPATLPEYDCPMHANKDCPGRCRYLRWWNAEADAIPGVPTDDTGKLGGTYGGGMLDAMGAGRPRPSWPAALEPEDDTGLDVESVAAWIRRSWAAEDRRALAARLLAPEGKE